ncbi:hypothetical protein TN53_12145 [Streptomyces sp. WM6386]|nr:hypothetical protein TN53_12145 [Streptomyces sp. WM6386]
MDVAVGIDAHCVDGGVGQAVVVEGGGGVVRAGVEEGDDVAGGEQGQRAGLGEQVAGEAARPAMSWGTGSPCLRVPSGLWAVRRRGQAAGMNTVRVATWAPAWVIAIGRPPETLVYSTQAEVKPFLASRDRPNSVTISYSPVNRAGAWAWSAAT